MLREMVEVLSEGEPNGNNMVIRIKLPSGLEVFGLPTKNFYGGEWDLGPTWNYAVLADRPFLVDTGRHGMGRRLLEMMESVGVSESDLESIVLSHGHEDHDGGLFEIVEATGARSLYGLRTYIRSLKKLEKIGSQLSNLVVLPAHRFFYGNHWNEIDLQVRIAELIQHHIDRCADILRILVSGPKTAKGIAKEHFDESLLEGMGAVMAENEILSHCELLCAAGDMGAVEDGRFESGGGSGFESLIKSLDAW